MEVASCDFYEYVSQDFGKFAEGNTVANEYTHKRLHELAIGGQQTES